MAKSNRRSKRKAGRQKSLGNKIAATSSSGETTTKKTLVNKAITQSVSPEAQPTRAKNPYYSLLEARFMKILIPVVGVGIGIGLILYAYLGPNGYEAIQAREWLDKTFSGILFYAMLSLLLTVGNKSLTVIIYGNNKGLIQNANEAIEKIGYPAAALILCIYTYMALESLLENDNVVSEFMHKTIFSTIPETTAFIISNLLGWIVSGILGNAAYDFLKRRTRSREA